MYGKMFFIDPQPHGVTWRRFYTRFRAQCYPCTHVLYVTELVGILFIWGGYKIMTGDDSLSIHAAQRAAKRREKQLA